MDAAIRRFVRERARAYCEYCRIPEKHSQLPHHIEHIVARQHGGSNEASNLALACHRCNLHKGPNLSGVDPVSGRVEVLFHPRKDHWSDHFALKGPEIRGKTAKGRATVEVLSMNDARRLELREEILRLGEQPG